MPTLTLTLGASQATRLFDALADRNSYNAAIHGTKAQFADVMIRKLLVNEVRIYERERDATIARDATDAAVVADIIIT